jgi:N-acetylglucosamine-6-sulfatase
MGLLGPDRAQAQPRRPNILFILADDHRWDALGCQGHPFLKTPHLDRLAAEGVLFENAFVTTSLCSPSRASFLTGQYAHSHGVVTNHTPWDDAAPTFLEHLNQAGYDTAFIGKWHMPGRGLPRLRGVNHFVSFTVQGGQGVYENCPLVIDGRETDRPGKYITEDLTDLAIDWLNRPRTGPFCLYLSHKAAHFGFLPPKHLRGRLKDADLHLPPEADPFVTMTNNQLFVGAPLPLGFLYRRYAETLMGLDEQIGRLLARLEALKVLDDTVVVYAGDNGHLFGEHGLYDKRLAFEESIRIPFIVRRPGKIPDPGRRAEQMALNIDLAPTLLDLAGLTIPRVMQGESLVPILASPQAPGRSSFLYEHFPVFPIPIPGITAVRTDRYKYIEYQNGIRPAELYDLARDPKEKNNLAAAPESQGLVQELETELKRLQIETGYRFFTKG